MSVPTNFPEMLSWLIEYYPALADEWVGQRREHGYACPDLEEWLGIKAAYILEQYRAWAASQQPPAPEPTPEPEPLPEDPEERKALLDELNDIVVGYNEYIAIIEDLLADLRVVREGIDNILSRM